VRPMSDAGEAGASGTDAHDRPGRLATGIPGFDTISEGGIVAGRSALLVGTSGSGKTIFGLQFLAEGVRQFDETGVLVTFEEVPEDIARNAAGFGWDVREMIASGALTIIDASPESAGTAEEFDFESLVSQIRLAIENVGAKRVVLDSIGALFPQFRDPFEVRRGLRRIVEELRPLGVTALISAERSDEYGGVARFEVEDFVVDGIIVLRNPLEQRTRSRTVEVLKLRGRSHLSGEYAFTIRPRVGIEVIPRPAFEVKQEASSQRVSTGNEELDRVCGGGFFRDSVVLVSGSTGTGKTLLGCEFVRAASERGERALYFSFEESRNQLLRNALSWGIDLAGCEREGTLRLEFRRPERMLLEDLLLEIREAVEEFRPERIAIDGLTTLERSSLPQPFREFSVSLISFMKERDITVVFSNTATLGMGTESTTEAHISTMTDAILMMRYVEGGGQAHRGLLVLKMRGTEHDTRVREYRISSSGLSIEGPMESVVGFIPGAPTMSADVRRTSEEQANAPRP
jgi:circadian clock protein KaiC